MSASRAPTIIVGRDLEILWENQAAIALLDAGRHFARAAGRVAPADKGQLAGFQSFLSDLGDACAAWACRSADGGHVLVRADAVSPPDADPATVLTVYPATASRTSAWADLGEIFGLTPAEAGIAKRLVGGDRAEAMAREMGISPETVRTHIRRIYSKLSVGSREELFSALDPFRVAVI
ncbi:helix-turn-helix transcriptional regulator [Caulobacter sp. KR2-114]|uniref:helix-turn-helix transcriptional regulator n=1 Tax=Caulobacter sp. KR2-114 TaxID=3400912 RepID=UPI003C0DC610